MILSTQEQTNITANAKVCSGPEKTSKFTALLTQMWSEVLGHDSFSLDDNYFDLGGDSLGVIELRNRLATKGVHLGMPDVFRYPNVRALAGHLASVSP